MATVRNTAGTIKLTPVGGDWHLVGNNGTLIVSLNTCRPTRRAAVSAATQRQHPQNPPR